MKTKERIIQNIEDVASAFGINLNKEEDEDAEELADAIYCAKSHQISRKEYERLLKI